MGFPPISFDDKRGAGGRKKNALKCIKPTIKLSWHRSEMHTGMRIEFYVAIDHGVFACRFLFIWLRFH